MTIGEGIAVVARLGPLSKRVTQPLEKTMFTGGQKSFDLYACLSQGTSNYLSVQYLMEEGSLRLH